MRVNASLWCLIAACLVAYSSWTNSKVAIVKDIRFVVIHKPGPNWKPGVPAFEQVGLQQHVEHYRQLLDACKLVLGGPFVDDASGGMMIPEPGVSEDEMRNFATADSAVMSGLLQFELRPDISTRQGTVSSM